MTIFQPDSGWRYGREPGGTFSFIFRVGLECSLDGEPARTFYCIEDVTVGREWRFTDYTSAAECLALRVQEVIHKPDPD